MNTLSIVLTTLIIYSTISTAIFLMTKEKEDVILIAGLGIVGNLLYIICKILQKINRFFKYHFGKRSIFENKKTGEKYKCRTSQTNNFKWLVEYKLIKRYARKTEWKEIPNFSQEIMQKAKINCDNCKYNKECDCSYPYTKIKCKNEFGTVVQFDKFEKK